LVGEADQARFPDRHRPRHARHGRAEPPAPASRALTLGHYIVTPRLDNPAALADFLADKDRAHSNLAGFRVSHKERVVDGRNGYVWDHGSPSGYWYFAAWFPEPVHSVRVECIAKRETNRFKRLCGEAMRTLEFR